MTVLWRKQSPKMRSHRVRMCYFISENAMKTLLSGKLIESEQRFGSQPIRSFWEFDTLEICMVLYSTSNIIAAGTATANKVEERSIAQLWGWIARRALCISSNVWVLITYPRKGIRWSSANFVCPFGCCHFDLILDASNLSASVIAGYYVLCRWKVVCWPFFLTIHYEVGLIVKLVKSEWHNHLSFWWEIGRQSAVRFILTDAFKEIERSLTVGQGILNGSVCTWVRSQETR